MSKTRYFALLLVFLCLCGCDHQTNGRYFLKHPEKLKAILLKCESAPTLQMRQDSQCLFAANLFNQIINLSRELEASPENFGKKILSLQMQQAQLKEQVASIKQRVLKAKGDESNFPSLQKKLQKLVKKLQKLSEEISLRQALVAEIEGM
jgi:hypothetical protein